MSEQTVEEAVVAAINGIVPTYPLVAREGHALPYAVYSLVFADIQNTMCGPSTLTNYRIRIDLYCETRVQMLSLRDQIIAAICAMNSKPIPVSDLDAFEPEISAMRRAIDFSIWDAVAQV